MAAGQGSSSSSSSSSSQSAGPVPMQVEHDSEQLDMLIEDTPVVPQNDVDYAEVFPTTITKEQIADYDRIHIASFGVSITKAPPKLPRIVPGTQEADEQRIIELRRKSDRRLIGFALVSRSSRDDTVDIWSVCKDAQLTSPRMVETLFRTFAERTPSLRQAFLTVATENNDTMTELGRLLLYTSVGFRLLPGQRVRDVFGNGMTVVAHSDANDVVVRKSDGTPLSLYVGVIRGYSSGEPMKMGATRRSMLAPRQTLEHITSNPYPTAVVNDFSRAVYPTPTAIYSTLFHMRLRPSGDHLDTFTLPTNVTLVTFTMPGSSLFGDAKFFGSIVQLVSRFLPVFQKKFPGYSTFPLYSLQPALRERDSKRRSMLATTFMLQFERRRIVTFCREQGSRPKQFQFDMQTYAPGMRCLNYDMGWDPTNEDDKSKGVGAVRYNPNGTFTTLPHVDAFVVTTPTLETLIKKLRDTHSPTDQLLVFVFGCAVVNREVGGELFYELAHRRSLNYTIELSDPIRSLIPFLTTATGVPTNLVASCPESSSSSSSGGRSTSRRPPSAPTRKVRRSSSSSKKRYTRRRRALRS